MRVRNIIKNGTWSLIAYLILFVFGLLNRRLFLTVFDDNILGYAGVFSNIFSLLSITEMGTSTVISYGLYREIENRNEIEIAKLMMIYKVVYRFVGGFIFLSGIIIMPLLPYIITGNNINWHITILLYIIQLINTISTYFMSFRRLLYICNQKSYICIKVDTFVNVLVVLIKIFIIIYIKNFMLYFIIDIFGTCLSNLILSIMCNREYPYARYIKIKKEDFIHFNFFKDTSAYLIQRIACAVYGGIDNILASKLLGVSSVVYLTNYTTIEAQVTRLLDKIMGGLQARIGSLIYSNELENNRKKNIYHALELYGYLLAIFVTISYFVMFQPVISLWLGEKYQLSNVFVFMFSINQYIAWNHRIIAYYRSALGDFKADLIYMIIGAIANVLLSVILAIKIGYTGLIFATVISHLILWYGRGKVVYTHLFGLIEYKKYWLMQLIKALLMIIELIIVYAICINIKNTVTGILIKGVLCLLIPNILNIFIFRNSEGILLLKNYMKSIFGKCNNIFK